MLNKTYKRYFGIVAAMIFTLLVACDDNDAKIKHYSAQVDADDASLKVDKYHLVTLFSLDSGKTFVDYPNVKTGQSYQMKVVHRTDDGDVDVVPSELGFHFDWSSSIPKPNGKTDGQIAEFTMQESNDIKVVISSHICSYNASNWAGAWDAEEVGTGVGGVDKNTLTQDETDPDKYTMNNFFGDGVEAYFTFAPSPSKYWDQVVTLPKQTTSEGGVASGSGIYDSCLGTFYIETAYEIDGKTLKWQYIFTRQE